MTLINLILILLLKVYNTFKFIGGNGGLGGIIPQIL